jgi:hypothetical protein
MCRGLQRFGGLPGTMTEGAGLPSAWEEYPSTNLPSRRLPRDQHHVPSSAPPEPRPPGPHALPVVRPYRLCRGAEPRPVSLSEARVLDRFGENRQPRAGTVRWEGSDPRQSARGERRRVTMIGTPCNGTGCNGNRSILYKEILLDTLSHQKRDRERSCVLCW